MVLKNEKINFLDLKAKKLIDSSLKKACQAHTKCGIYKLTYFLIVTIIINFN